jgi:molybdate transport system ATP-binding protein
MFEVDIQWRRGRLPIQAAFRINPVNGGLLGPSACGKSCLLRLLAGVYRPERGRIVLDGKVLFDSRRGLDRLCETGPVGLVPAEAGFDGRKTVLENLRAALPGGWRQLNAPSLEEIVDLLGLQHLLGFRARHLSNGERQRIALGRELLKAPRVLLLDDALSALDGDMRSKILGWLRYSHRERGLGVIQAASQIGDLLRLTDYLILMEQGRVEHAGFLSRLTAEQVLLPAAGSAIDNVLPVTVLLHDVTDACTVARFFGIRLTLPYLPHAKPGGIGYVGVRSRDIALALRPLPDVSIQNQIKSRVCAVIPRDDRLLVQVDAGAILTAEITKRAYAAMPLEEGDTVYCFIKTHNFTWLLEDAQMAVARWKPALAQRQRPMAG